MPVHNASMHIECLNSAVSDAENKADFVRYRIRTRDLLAAYLAASHLATTATHEAGQAPLALRWWWHRLLINSILLIAIAARVTIATAATT